MFNSEFIKKEEVEWRIEDADLYNEFDFDANNYPEYMMIFISDDKEHFAFSDSWKTLREIKQAIGQLGIEHFDTAQFKYNGYSGYEVMAKW